MDNLKRGNTNLGCERSASHLPHSLPGEGGFDWLCAGTEPPAVIVEQSIGAITVRTANGDQIIGRLPEDQYRDLSSDPAAIRDYIRGARIAKTERAGAFISASTLRVLLASGAA